MNGIPNRKLPVIWRAGLTCALLAAAPLAAQAESVLLRVAKIHTMTGETLEPGALLIENGKITKVAKSLDDQDGAKTIERSDAVVMPGLVGAYSQIGVNGGTSEFTREITPDFQLSRSIDWRSRSFREARGLGVTSVFITPGTHNVIAGAGVLAKTAGEAKAKRVLNRNYGLLVTMASDPRFRNSSRRRPDSIFVRQPTNRMGVVWLMRNAMHRAQTSPNPTDARLVEALRGKRPMFAVSRTAHDITALLSLASEFKFTPTVIGGQEAHKLAEQLAKRKIPVILGPIVNSLTTGTESTAAAWNQAGALHAAGVPVALTGADLLQQARFAVRYGLPADVALQAVTATPAKLLGAEARIGTIAPGRDADLVLLNGDPLEFTTSVQTVVVDGVFYETKE